ncbi:MAG: hypothetical protein KatS3mg108_0469 [Isosphaeraceae bacterium]|jgi:hypothetical protein|nr:MAG: hypothetical protein KatS3mg108_0469 [Isosphaeraceae bacterium]
MKRIAAAVVLLLAVTALVKLARWTDRATSEPARRSPSAAAEDTARASALEFAAVKARYPEQAELVARVLDRYQHTALKVERLEGLRGLRLLDRLDLDAVFLLERHPDEFRRLASVLSDDAAADLLLHWRAYFALKRADEVDRAILIDEIARLAPSRRAMAARYPSALALILAEPIGVCDLIRRLGDDPAALDDALSLLDLISLAEGPASLRRALITLENDRVLALEAFRRLGPEGFALVALYAPVLRAVGDSLPLDQALIVLRVNSDDVDELLRTRSPETVAALLRHLAAVGLIEVVGSSQHGLRLAIEYGELGDQALRQAGADAADVVYGALDDPLLRHQAVAALAEYGSMAAAMLAKYAFDDDFRHILGRDGPAVIPPIARADAAPEVLLKLRGVPRKSFTEALAEQVLSLSGENGQAVIRTIRHDGLARVQELDRGEVRFDMFLPLYDLLHLGGVVARGHTPTSGEMAWALIDGCLIVMDVVSLAALQPAAAAAAEAARSEVKATARAAVRSAGREAVAQTAQTLGSATSKAARWWAVRAAGGTYRVLTHWPEALGRMSLEQLAHSAGPFCARAGIRLSKWKPVRVAQDGASRVLQVPPQVWTKYVGINVVQAGVGVVAMHKMEEWLGSRRPVSPGRVK